MSAASATTPSSRMWRDSSASASSTASWSSSTLRGACSTTTGSPPSARLSSVGGEREAVGPGVVQRVADVVRHLRADELEEDRRRHRQPQAEDGLVRLLDGVAVVERLRDDGALAAEEAVHDECGRVAHEDAGLAELLRHRPRGRERRVVGHAACERARRAGSTATGLKKCMPTTRSGCSRSAPISVTESDDVFVARTHSAETTRSSSAKTSFFTAISSNTASSTRSQPAKRSHPVPPVTSEREEARLAFAEAAAADELGELVLRST